MISTPCPPHLLTRRVIPRSTRLRRGYATEASLLGHGPGHATETSLIRHAPRGQTSLIPQSRDHTPDRPANRLSQLEPYKKTNLELELRWLKDPVKLAAHTVGLLHRDNLWKALEIVRLASKYIECTVSWNHLIDYQMSKANVADAVKLYNEMKKRAQQPDAYTFTLIFRGFSWSSHSSQSASRALHIYQSMFAEKSPVRPSIIHTNAILKVCALAYDVDAILGIAAELPTRGNNAPNNITFTTILNAIRTKAVKDASYARCSQAIEDESKGNEIGSLAVRQGRKLWVEIRQRWISGDLRLDEELVCAMGRLLLLGSKAQDHDDVLSLLEQTMAIPRQIARVAHAAPGDPGEAIGPNDRPRLPSCSPANTEMETLPSPWKEEPPSDPFAPLFNAAGPTQSAIPPGCNTLSLALEACLRLKYVRAGQNYWGLLTSPDGYYRVIPDSENYHVYLRQLRLQRSSKLAVELVSELMSGDLTGKAGAVHIKTFRIALSCCVRDIKNKNVVLHAGKLVKMMMGALPYPDAKSLSMYVEIALGQKSRDWRVLMGMIRDTELGVRNLRSLLAYDPAGPQKQDEKDVLELVWKLIRAYDVVLDHGKEEMRREEKKRCSERRNTLAAYHTRGHNRRVAEGTRSSEKGRLHPLKEAEEGGGVMASTRRMGRVENAGFESEKEEVVARRRAGEAGLDGGDGERADSVRAGRHRGRPNGGPVERHEAW